MRYTLTTVALLVGFLACLSVASFRPAVGQAWTPPYCTGPNRALQYGPNGWICVTITAMPLPAAPPPTECITANWDGTKWNCVPTENLTAR